MLCREESIKVWNARQQFEEAGVRLVCVLHEWIDREVDAFRPKYWGEWGGLAATASNQQGWLAGCAVDMPRRQQLADRRATLNPTSQHPPPPPPPPPGGELYYDQDKAFYAAVHGGKPARASLLQLLSPTVWRAGKRAKDSGLVKDSNYKGDGLTLGGERARHGRLVLSRRLLTGHCSRVMAWQPTHRLCSVAHLWAPSAVAHDPI